MKVKVRKVRKVTKRKNALLSTRKRFCRFCVDKVRSIDYKDAKTLEMFIRDRGKIVASRLSGNCAKHQRILIDAIKKARFVSLVPYTRI